MWTEHAREHALHNSHRYARQMAGETSTSDNGVKSNIVIMLHDLPRAEFCGLTVPMDASFLIYCFIQLHDIKIALQLHPAAPPPTDLRSTTNCRRSRNRSMRKQ
ncbi:hypothetical protein N7533_002113 [Penicillium manginii]|uniref:uncharacterized protein n=1 Tax=Penicillium manginii TaxID=203109 RepID=UPI00254793A8|nr:uncharacterized protein N7533_002113 [Penicillium manginii]KAJ5763432.1 hypothetical protein N7533_002113 [Penicillium manginii]